MPSVSPASSATTAPSTRGDRFFSWTAGLGIMRGEGWIGGVAAGLAARLGVDPLVTRGVLVVVGLFGFPVLFLYGLAWAVLPDLDGRIPLQQAVRGRFVPAQVGAGLFLVAGLLPAPIVVLWGGGILGGIASSAPGVVGGAITLFTVGVLIAAVLIFLIVRFARTASGAPGVEPRTASADSAAPDDSAEASGRESDASAGERGGEASAGFDPSLPAPPLDLDARPDPADPRPAAPEPVAADASADDLAAWRLQHAAWKEQDQRWRREQQDAQRAVREQARRERQARATAFAAEAAERRRARRAAHPRASFPYVAAAIGLAVVVGAGVALNRAGTNPDTAGASLAPSLGLFTAAFVLAAAMVLAGFLRRRSGFLAFVTVLALTGAAAASAVPVAVALHLGGYGISNRGDESFPATAPFVQPWGDVSVYLDDTGGDGATYIEKRDGGTYIAVRPGVEVTLELTTSSASAYFSGSNTNTVDLATAPGAERRTLSDGRVRYTFTARNGEEPPSTRERLLISQDAGVVDLYLLDVPEEDAS